MSCDILSQNSISDTEFLQLMIKHHNVAINMSHLVQLNTKDDYIYGFARRLVYNYTMEVNLLERLLKSMPNVQNASSCNCGNTLLTGRVKELYPSVFENKKCDNMFFENFGNTPLQLRDTQNFEVLPGKQIEHFTQEVVPLSDKEYTETLLSHHKTCVDLCKLVLKSTKEPKILSLAQTILLRTEKEMFELSSLSNCNSYDWRKMLNN
jgi:uncharacterized protein (DUF305 family)